MAIVTKYNVREPTLWSFKKISLRSFVIISVLLVLIFAMVCQEEDLPISFQGTRHLEDTTGAKNKDTEALVQRALSLYQRIIQTPDDASYGGTSCATCGCPRTRRDCPRHYSICDVHEHAVVTNPQANAYWANLLQERHQASRHACNSTKKHSMSGGWCLGTRATKDGYVITLPHKTSTSIMIPSGHVRESERIAVTLESLIRNEKVQSICDFGAGIGQYGASLLRKFQEEPLGHEFTYRGYDGSGDVEEYTKGFLSYIDLTLPLDYPVSDWVVSLEVGEHIPSKYEGMFIRNLHRHNRKGIILSWAVLGQSGDAHINNHSNEYVEAIFKELGYTRDLELETQLRNPVNNHGWFVNSAMVFRRGSNSPLAL